MRSFADGGTNTLIGHATAAANVAAASAALPHDAMASGGRRHGGPCRWPRHQPHAFGRQQVEQDREQVAGLVAAGHVGGLVLDPHAPRRGEAERVREPVRAAERRPSEPGAGDRGDRGVGLLDQRDPRQFRHPRRRGERIPGQRTAEREERVGIVDASSTTSSSTATAAPPPTIWRTWCRSASVAFGQRHDSGVATSTSGAAHRAAEAGDARRRDGHDPAATRALKSAINSSQIGRWRRRSRQNDCERRLSNTSNGVPCCSTHV